MKRILLSIYILIAIHAGIASSLYLAPEFIEITDKLSKDNSVIEEKGLYYFQNNYLYTGNDYSTGYLFLSGTIYTINNIGHIENIYTGSFNNNFITLSGGYTLNNKYLFRGKKKIYEFPLSGSITINKLSIPDNSVNSIIHINNIVFYMGSPIQEYSGSTSYKVIGNEQGIHLSIINNKVYFSLLKPYDIKELSFVDSKSLKYVPSKNNKKGNPTYFFKDKKYYYEIVFNQIGCEGSKVGINIYEKRLSGKKFIKSFQEGKFIFTKMKGENAFCAA